MEKYLNKEFLLRHKKTIMQAGVVFLLIVIAFFVLFTGGNGKEEALSVTTAPVTDAAGQEGEETTAAPQIIYVDVGGAVRRPQVVQLEEGSRVDDAIGAAGGLGANADLTNLNRAAVLADGEKLYIPAQGEEAMPEAGVFGAGTGSGGIAAGKVNLNRATSEELQTLTGVGPATAQKILEYRQANGAFRSIEDIKNVSGIGEKTFEKLKDYISV